MLDNLRRIVRCRLGSQPSVLSGDLIVRLRKLVADVRHIRRRVLASPKNDL